MNLNFKIILATESPHRQKILKKMGIPFEAHAPNVDERSLERSFHGPLEGLSGHLALKKAESLKNLFSDQVIVGSDQVLIFNKQIFPKPESGVDVIKRLQFLQGKTHFLSTAIAIFHEDRSRPVYQKTVTSTMTMHSLCKNEILSYVETDSSLGCAGGYLFEKRGALLFKEVNTSDPYSIIGLPLLTLVDWLRQTGKL